MKVDNEAFWNTFKDISDIVVASIVLHSVYICTNNEGIKMKELLKHKKN